jgi:cholesterol transport system auxiliary component
MSDILRRQVLVGLGATGLTAALAACAGPKPPEVRKFYLSALAERPAGAETGTWSLQVDPTEAIPALNSSRIAQVIASNEFDYYADADWGDVAPVMFQSVLINSFQRTGALPEVTSERARTRPDFLLQTSLTRFYGKGAVGTAAVASVGVTAELTRYSGRETVGTATFEDTAQAASPEIEALIDAFNSASKSVIGQLIDWTVSTGNSAGARS